MQYIPLKNNLLVEFDNVKNPGYKKSKIILASENGVTEPEFLINETRATVVDIGDEVDSNIKVGDRLIISMMRNVQGEKVNLAELAEKKQAYTARSLYHSGGKEPVEVLTVSSADVKLKAIINENSIMCILKENE